jgi:hypothetical protein
VAAKEALQGPDCQTPGGGTVQGRFIRVGFSICPELSGRGVVKRPLGFGFAPRPDPRKRRVGQNEKNPANVSASASDGRLGGRLGGRLDSSFGQLTVSRQALCDSRFDGGFSTVSWTVTRLPAPRLRPLCDVPWAGPQTVAWTGPRTVTRAGP